MTRTTSSTLTLAAAAGISAGLAAFFALVLTGTGQAQSLPAAKSVAPPMTQVSVTAVPTPPAAPATQLAQGRDGQRTVRVVYAGPIMAR